MQIRSVLPYLLLGTVVSLGCIGVEGTTKSASADANPIDPRFEARVLAIAREYENYGRLDTEAHPAPGPCADVDRHGLPKRPRYSASPDEGTHGLKLYSLFVKEQHGVALWGGDYALHGKPQPVGQVVVKESWVAEEIPDTGQPLKAVERRMELKRETADGREEIVPHLDRFIPYARNDGRLYHAAHRGSLFIMYKEDPQTQGTDQGWVYGTATPDATQVNSAGLVSPCLGCHRNAPHDRLFGNPPADPKRRE